MINNNKEEKQPKKLFNLIFIERKNYLEKKKYSGFILFFSFIGISILSIILYVFLNQGVLSVKIFVFVFKQSTHNILWYILLFVSFIGWLMILFLSYEERKKYFKYYVNIILFFSILCVFLIIINQISPPIYTEYLSTLIELNKNFNWDKIIYSLFIGLFFIFLNIVLIEIINFQNLLTSPNKEISI